MEKKREEIINRLERMGYHIEDIPKQGIMRVMLYTKNGTAIGCMVRYAEMHDYELIIDDAIRHINEFIIKGL